MFSPANRQNIHEVVSDGGLWRGKKKNANVEWVASLADTSGIRPRHFPEEIPEQTSSW